MPERYSVVFCIPSAYTGESVLDASHAWKKSRLRLTQKWITIYLMNFHMQQRWSTVT